MWTFVRNRGYVLSASDAYNAACKVRCPKLDDQNDVQEQMRVRCAFLEYAIFFVAFELRYRVRIGRDNDEALSKHDTASKLIKRAECLLMF